MRAADVSAHHGLGLVVGKFSPLHVGHEWLIREAAHRCDRLLILSYANPEFPHCQASTRRRWLRTRFPEHEAVVFDQAELQDMCLRAGVAPREVPGNASSDLTQQQFLAWILREVLSRRPDVFFCSEPYGVDCAARLTRELGHAVKAVVFDTSRQRFPVSATTIRQDPVASWAWIAKEVRCAFVRRIALLGGESSGKTTLAKALGCWFKTNWVPEYGRELWERQSGQLSEADLLLIAHEHVRREDRAVESANGFVFCDTSPLTTAGYGDWMFGRVDPELAGLALRPYDGVILCAPDFPFVQDGTRRDPSFQRQQHAWYLQRLRDVSFPVLEARGDVEQRIRDAAAWLGNLNSESKTSAGRAD